MLIAITPTEGRPGAFALLRRCVAAQSQRPDRWIVVGADHSGYDLPPEATVLRPESERGTPAGLCRNLLLALDHLPDPADKIVILEDDDYYKSGYLEQMSGWLDSVALAGESRQARYYNVRTRRCRQSPGAAHASLAVTGFRRELVPLVAKIAARGSTSVDLSLWEEWRGSKAFFDGLGLHIGVKGMPGLGGLGAGHRPDYGVPDLGLEVARAWGLPTGDYAGFYEPTAPNLVPDQPPPRVVYLLNSFGIAGGIRIIVEHLNGLVDRGHQVTLAVKNGDLPRPGWMPIRFPVCTLAEAQDSGLWDSAEVRVATHWSTAADVAGDGRRTYYFVQSREDWFYHDEKKQSLARATYSLPLRPIATSRWVKEFLEGEFEHREVPVLRNGVNFEMFFPEPGHFPRAAGVHRVLIEGHEVIAAKNLSDAFDVVAELRRRDLAIEVYGFSQVENNYPYDRFWLRPDTATIRRLYSDADVLIKTSRFEGRPLPMVEAMACGCSVASTDCRGTDDLIGHAAITPVGDIAAMADAVEKLMLDPHARAKQVDRAMNYARSTLRWRDAIDHLERLLGLTPSAGLHRGDVCVLIPTYDRPQLIGRALASLLAQTRPDWRAIVLRNGGRMTAEYDEALRQFQSDPRIEIVDRPEPGLPDALNVGLARARAEYIAVLDDDDEWHPDFLDALTLPLDHDPSRALAFCDLAELRGGEPLALSKPPDQSGFRFRRDILLGGNWIPFPCAVFRRRAIADLGGFDPAACGCTDWDCWLRLTAAHPEVAHIRRALAIHHWHEANLSLDKSAMAPAMAYIRLKRDRGDYESRRQSDRGHHQAPPDRDHSTTGGDR